MRAFCARAGPRCGSADNGAPTMYSHAMPASDTEFSLYISVYPRAGEDLDCNPDNLSARSLEIAKSARRSQARSMFPRCHYVARAAAISLPWKAGEFLNPNAFSADHKKPLPRQFSDFKLCVTLFQKPRRTKTNDLCIVGIPKFWVITLSSSTDYEGGCFCCCDLLPCFGLPGLHASSPRQDTPPSNALTGHQGSQQLFKCISNSRKLFDGRGYDPQRLVVLHPT